MNQFSMLKTAHSKKRRDSLAYILGAMGAPALFAQSTTSQPGDEVVLGQSLALTGPLAEIGQDFFNGTRAHFEGINARGGVHGRKLRLMTLDDGYQVSKTVKNVEKFMDERVVFGLMNIMGTPNCAAILPAVRESGIPFIAPLTGASVVRTPLLRNVFNIRASYANEIEKIVYQLNTIGQKKIAVVWQNNSFGKEGLEGVQKDMKNLGMTLAHQVSIESDASDAEQAVAALSKHKLEAVILITAGRSTFEFIKRYRQVSRGTTLYTLSVMGTQAAINALGEDGVGVVVASVVPFPWSLSSKLAIEYREDMRRVGVLDQSFLSFEGYINAKVVTELLKRAGRELTRERFFSAADALRRLDLGGFEVEFSREKRQASKRVELTMIGRHGKFTK